MKEFAGWATAGTITVGLLLGLTMWGCPQYKVYSSGKEGEARLKEAESSRKIAVLEAEAKKESAVRLAEAEVARAVGVAEANKIIGESLKDNESYLRYLWIQGLQDGSSEVIYVPTEANLPIMEATRLMPKVVEKKNE
jgi:regulator of protease activity HflC (stomatin/prohibitin superfamily)